MSLSTKIERTKRAKLRKEMLVESKLEHCLVIGSYLELQISNLGLLYMDRRVRHRPTTFMWSLRFKDVVFKSKLQQQQRSLNLSCSPNTVQCSAYISSFRSPNDLNVFFHGKKREFPRTFMRMGGSDSDVRNDVLFKQEDKDFHQVKSWSPTQQLVIKSIVSNFSL